VKTADLLPPLLDYWTARAEGVPADQLDIRRLPRPGDPRTPDAICVRQLIGNVGTVLGLIRVDYSTNWALAGPLVEKHRLDVYWLAGRWRADIQRLPMYAAGDTPLIAICRAVVRAAFGDEVEDLPC